MPRGFRVDEVQCSRLLGAIATSMCLGAIARADFDGSGIVDKQDLSLLLSCLGTVRFISYDADDGPSADDARRTAECGVTDVDRDGIVTLEDLAIATSMLGMPPGPSAKSRI
ncbi:hypothetical protein AKJ08_1767 [Vulgatibacter incomptus]|uniref:EF-hand domain-containing protein n=1 Tax=Vulgatibacter incomptus TaxID=1391653 RepID=A0A0K1PCY2_9BACT|nr:hypothetical protein AKJ08_1767 [Vulgatibacter incomptus]